MFSSCKSVRMLFENKRKGEETMMKQMTRNKAAGRKNKKKSMQWAAAVMALALTGMNASEMAAMIPMQVKAAETANSIIDGTQTTGSLAIKRMSKETGQAVPIGGARYSIYKIMSLIPGSTVGEFASFEKVAAYQDVLKTVQPDELFGSYSAAELDALAIRLEQAAAEQTPTASGITAETDGTYTFENLAFGYYLIVETKAPDGYVAGKPFLVSIPSTDNYQSNAAGTKWVYDVAVAPKSAEISIDKKLADSEDGSVKEGDYVQYVIETSIPEYTEDYTNPKFIIKDTMSDGLEILNDTTHPVTIKIDGIPISASLDTYAFTAENKTGTAEDLSIQFQPDYIKQNLGKAVEVTYFAKVNDKAVMGITGNSNQAVLEYHNKPGTDAQAESAEIKVYSFGIEVEKFAKPSAALEGAVFELYSNENLSAENKIGTATSDKDGKLQFSRLDEGIYYLKETQSPAGYTLLANPVKIEITASEMNQVATGTFTLKVNDKEITATDGSFVTKLNTDSGISTVAVENQKGFSLPETGGIGIMIFLGIGIVGILILSGIMVKKMKL